MGDALGRAQEWNEDDEGHPECGGFDEFLLGRKPEHERAA